jgi:hypothetical protein
MPVPPAERLLVGQASCLPLMGNSQDACSTSREITCEAGKMPASDGQQPNAGSTSREIVGQASCLQPSD